MSVGDNPEREAYPAEKARGGEIILRRRWQRATFIAGLAVSFVIAVALAIYAMAS